METFESDCDQVHALLQHQLRNKLIRLRRERHWSLKDLSSRSGFSVKILQSIENGTYDISPAEAVRLLDALDMGVFSFYQN